MDKFLIRKGLETNYFYTNGERIKEGDIIDVTLVDEEMCIEVTQLRGAVIFDARERDHVISIKDSSPNRQSLRTLAWNSDCNYNYRHNIVKNREIDSENFDLSEECLELSKTFSEYSNRKRREVIETETPKNKAKRSSLLSWLLD